MLGPEALPAQRNRLLIRGFGFAHWVAGTENVGTDAVSVSVLTDVVFRACGVDDNRPSCEPLGFVQFAQATPGLSKVVQRRRERRVRLSQHLSLDFEGVL